MLVSLIDQLQNERREPRRLHSSDPAGTSRWTPQEPDRSTHALAGGALVTFNAYTVSLEDVSADDLGADDFLF